MMAIYKGQYHALSSCEGQLYDMGSMRCILYFDSKLYELQVASLKFGVRCP